MRPAVPKMRRQGAIDQVTGEDRLGFEIAAPSEKKAARHEQKDDPQPKTRAPVHFIPPA